MNGMQCNNMDQCVDNYTMFLLCLGDNETRLCCVLSDLALTDRLSCTIHIVMLSSCH